MLEWCWGEWCWKPVRWKCPDVMHVSRESRSNLAVFGGGLCGLNTALCSLPLWRESGPPFSYNTQCRVSSLSFVIKCGALGFTESGSFKGEGEVHMSTVTIFKKKNKKKLSESSIRRKRGCFFVFIYLFIYFATSTLACYQARCPNSPYCLCWIFFSPNLCKVWILLSMTSPGVRLSSGAGNNHAMLHLSGHILWPLL